MSRGNEGVESVVLTGATRLQMILPADIAESMRCQYFMQAVKAGVRYL